jgi:hypothetical protein
MPAAARRANWGAIFTSNCAGRALASGPSTCPQAPLRLRAARRLAVTERWRPRGGACVPQLLGACAAAPALQRMRSGAGDISRVCQRRRDSQRPDCR